MTMTGGGLLERVETQDAGSDVEDWQHFLCFKCFPDPYSANPLLAVCGTDITGDKERPDPVNCIVCIDVVQSTGACLKGHAFT